MPSDELRVDVREMEEHPGGDDALERSVAERETLGVADACINTSFQCEFDHARRDVDHHDFAPQLGRDSGRELSRPAADLQHACRRYLSDGVERKSAGVRPVRVLVERPSRLEVVLRRVLARDRLRVVDLHRSTIARPGAPLPGCFAPSQADTVAPTSPNSPSSWMRPAAFFPAAYARSSAYSREWSVDGVVGSQPWSDVRIRRSPSRSASRMSGSRRSKSCRQRWKFTGSLRCPQSWSVSTGFTNTSPASTFSRSSVVRLMPSTFDFVGNDASTSHPAKMSEIFPTPYVVWPASRMAVR